MAFLAPFKTASDSPLVIPMQAGIQGGVHEVWIPAFAGMTCKAAHALSDTFTLDVPFNHAPR
jgi:hypothetical protein